MPPPPPPPPPPPLVLGEAQIPLLSELLRMEDRRQLDAARLAVLLRDTNTVVRRRAVLAAGRIGDDAATPLLLDALGDEDVRVRADAAFALGLLGNTASSVIAALAAKLADPGAASEVASEAVAALARLAAPDGPGQTTAAEPAATAALRSRLARHAPGAAADSPGPPIPMDDVGRATLVALWRIPALAQLHDVILPHFDAPDAETRWSAVYPFTRQDAPPAVVPYLRLRLVSDPDASVRALAARALRVTPVDAAGERTRVIEALLASLTDVHSHVRINALGALAGYRDADVAESIAFRTDDPDGNVTIAALRTLGTLGGPAAVAALERTARSNERPIGIRSAAMNALAVADHARALDVLPSWIASPDWLARFHAVSILTRSGEERSGESLRRLARDPDPRVAAAALRAITGPDTDDGALETLLLESLGSGDPVLRAAAADALARDPNPAHTAALMEAYDRSRFDEANVAALAAIDALAALEGRGVPVSRAFFLRFPRSPDRAVQARVARHFGVEPWGAPDPAPERALSFYAEVMRTLVIPSILGGREPTAVIGTTHGEIEIRLAAAEAPLTVMNFLELVDRGYYTSMSASGTGAHRWHRVVPAFVLQDGDPRGDGQGGPGHSIRDEINRLRYERGVLGMALSGPDTGGAQFFITHSPQPHLDGGYTIFGRVAAGMDAADRVIQDDPVLYIRVYR